ncbi:MAG: hypothetical protein WC178_04825 [Candidatus Paceibacterota bacterium]
MFNKKSLQKLRDLAEADGYHMTDEELLEMAVSLYSLIETVYRPIKKEWLGKIER